MKSHVPTWEKNAGMLLLSSFLVLVGLAGSAWIGSGRLLPQAEPPALTGCQSMRPRATQPMGAQATTHALSGSETKETTKGDIATAQKKEGITGYSRWRSLHRWSIQEGKQTLKSSGLAPPLQRRGVI